MEMLNDARSEFMVHFLDNILLNGHSLSLLANHYNSFSRCSMHCQRLHQRTSTTCRVFQDSDIFKSDICS